MVPASRRRTDLSLLDNRVSSRLSSLLVSLAKVDDLLLLNDRYKEWGVLLGILRAIGT